MRLCQRLCEHTSSSCVRENTAGQMFVFAPDTSCLPRDERSKKFVPEEIKGAHAARRIVIQRRQKGQNLLWKKKRSRPEQIGHSTFLSSALAAVQPALWRPAIYLSHSLAHNAVLKLRTIYNIYAHLRAKSKWARSQGKCRSRASRGCTPAAYLIGRVRAL